MFPGTNCDCDYDWATARHHSLLASYLPPVPPTVSSAASNYHRLREGLDSASLFPPTMQSTLDGPAALGPAFSPVQKQRLDMSGYPSPPSSGRTEHQDGQEEGGVGPETRHRDAPVEVETRARANEVIISPRPEASQSLSPPASCEEEEEEEGDEVEHDEYSDDDDEYSDDQDGDATVMAGMERSLSGTSWSDSPAPSSPSTSIATTSQSTLFHRARADTRTGSPYMDEQLPLAPIRDTPGNPFLQGGPADVGHTGPNRSKRVPSRSMPRERGRMTYVL